MINKVKWLKVKNLVGKDYFIFLFPNLFLLLFLTGISVYKLLIIWGSETIVAGIYFFYLTIITNAELGYSKLGTIIMRGSKEEKEWNKRFDLKTRKYLNYYFLSIFLVFVIFFYLVN